MYRMRLNAIYRNEITREIQAVGVEGEFVV